MAFSRRYERNQNTIDVAGQAKLSQATVLVVGCGGLGGFVLEGLARIGVGHLRMVDGDAFEETNLNRQLFCTTANLGERKAIAARDRIALVNPDVDAEARVTLLAQDNADALLCGATLAVDALDSIAARKVLESACHRAGIPMIHGSIAGDYGQVGVSVPNAPLFCHLQVSGASLEKTLGNPFYTPCVVAGYEVKLVVDVLTGNPYCTGGFYFIDMGDMSIVFQPAQ